MKSERLKKLELELQDLEQWLNLGLVPKKDLDKHKEEIDILKKRVTEEKQRIQSQKESGEGEEYTVPKRNAQQRASYQEPHTLGGEDLDEGSGLTQTGLDDDSPSFSYETGGENSTMSEEARTTISEDDEDPFSDRNRWRRGILEDPDGDSW